MFFDHLRSRSDFVFLVHCTIDSPNQLQCGLAFFGADFNSPIGLYNSKDELVAKLKPIDDEGKAIATGLVQTDRNDLIILELTEVSYGC